MYNNDWDDHNRRIVLEGRQALERFFIYLFFLIENKFNYLFFQDISVIS